MPTGTRKVKGRGVQGRLLFLALVLLAPAGAARGAESLLYVLKPDFDRHVMHVELTWETGSRPVSGLQVSPRVGPIENIAAILQQMRFSGAQVQQQGSLWILKHRPNAVIRCSYTVDPRQRGFSDWGYAHAPITATRFFHGLGNAFLLAPNTGGGAPDEYDVLLRWQLPAGYRAVCSWGAGRSVGARLRSADLRQSVYLAGDLKLQRVEDEGRKIIVAMIDRFGFTPEEFAERTAAIIRAQCAFMHEQNFPEFVITAIPAGPKLKPGEARIAGSGLYHSFALFMAPESALDDAVEHLFAHELFHHWNGRLLRARQPERLVYWFIEGFTDYYSLRILYESGLWDAKTYAKWVNRHLREYHENPAINATNEQINDAYWTERETVGEVAYQRGLLLGLRWHHAARKIKPDGIDALFRTLLRRARRGGFELSNAAVRTEGRKLYGEWFATEFDRYVNRAATVDLPTGALSPDFVGKVDATYAYALGFDGQRSIVERVVRGLEADSNAAKAGLREGDALVGWKLTGDANELAQLQVRRRDGVKTIAFYPRGPKRTVLQFSPGK